MNVLRNLLLVGFVITALSACKEEKPDVYTDPVAQSNYEVYMNDYDPPEKKWGYIDLSGRLVIPNLYDDCREFQEGRAAINFEGRWGYIDREGKEVIAPFYRATYGFSSGRALVEDFAGRSLFIDTEGKEVLDVSEYNEVYPYTEGLARVKKAGYFGAIDISGKMLIEPEYDRLTAMVDGYSIGILANQSHLIDQKGKVVLKVDEELRSKMYQPASGKVRCKVGKKYRYYTVGQTNNAKRSVKEYADATDYQGEYAVVYDRDEYHLIDRQEKVVKRLPYKHVAYGGEGKWIYYNGKKYGYLSNDGRPYTMALYDAATRYRSSMAAVEYFGNWGYIDSEGHLAVKAQYPLAWNFIGDRARMISREGYGFIDKKGSFVIRPYYIEVRDFSESLARVQIWRD